ncbi:MAG: type IV secretory system conjugative DNA transfer family protein [Nostoc sp. ChiQUE01a]|nr:type IV secretory system conjugative DNA transfer family protein [Nostoc sp. ChiQUE01a]
MSYLTPQHEQLARQQQSSFMQWFGQLPFDKKIAAIGVSLTIGVTCTAASWTLEASDRIYFCIRTPHQVLRCVDNNKRPYRMTLWHWQQWKKDGMPTVVVPNEGISPKGLVKATNPHKPLWAMGAFVGFATAGWMLRHLQDNERKLANFQAIAETRDVAQAELKARSQLLDDYREFAMAQVELQTSLDMIANDHTVDIQKAEILGEIEIKITQMEANDAVFEAETAGMSEEQKQEYINFLKSQKTPYLQGSQTLQGTIDPSDKVEGSGDKEARLESENTGGEISETTQNQTSRNDASPTLEPLNRILGAKRSTLIVGGTGAGKSVTESYMLNRFSKRFPQADVWAIAQKNDSFCGLDKKGRVLLFDPLEPQLAMAAIDQVYNSYDQRRRVPEHRRHEFDNQPVRLILADWHSIYETCKDEAWFQPYLKKISTIITVGRELNVCLIIDTQSFNLAALGIGDSNIRKNLYIIAQGNYNVEADGTVNDSYGVLYNLITNAKIVEDAVLRSSLKERFTELKSQSKQLGQPLIFISVEPMQLDILPDITSYKPGIKPAIQLDTVSPEYLDNLLRLEFDIDVPTTSINSPLNQTTNHRVDENASDDNQASPDIKLTEIQTKLVDYLKGKGAKTPRQIKQNAGSKFKGVSEAQIRDELNLLVQKEKVICTGEDSYRLVD